MKILAIETSCDETAISVVEAIGGASAPSFTILSQIVASQIDIHKEWGGVVPNLAKREHQKLLVPTLLKALADANIEQSTATWSDHLTDLLNREPILAEIMRERIGELGTPTVDYITVTAGPGLEPALWVGINFARALGELWGITVVGANHMEGHIMSPLLLGTQVTFPAVALLISGGHTELVHLHNWLEYSLIGITRDDAIGEAFDKVARVLDLPYPGGPEISKLAQKGVAGTLTLPRPMIDKDNCDFSFSGLKTAVKYYADDHQPVSDQLKADIALEFEQAATDVVIAKTTRALEETNAKTLIVGGGVIANKRIRAALETLIANYPEITLLIPDFAHTGDNASMIAAAAYIRIEKDKTDLPLTANGSMVLSE